jgi:cytosine/adenosine deaminase-related metal-dependent hydrolase
VDPSHGRDARVTNQARILKAAWIAPMDQPILRDGAVAFDQGRILAVGKSPNVVAMHPHAEVEDLGNSILLPGLVNAHVHLELSDCRSQATAGCSFVDWIMTMRQRSGGADPAAATKLGIEQCLRFGVTCVGDITQQIDVTRQILSQSRLRGVSFGEVLGLAQRRARFDELFPRAIDPQFQSEALHIGITPHAPYTVDLDGYRQCVRTAKQRGILIATHLAETLDERTFLQSHAGPFRELWDAIGSWCDDVPTFRGGPIEMAHAIGLLDLPAVLAHINYCSDEQLDLLASGQSSVVYCPRTHAYFGHPPHRWRQMLERGVNVAIGTDSCASSPDLNLVDDLRLLHTIAGEVSAQNLWELVTVRGARALGLSQTVGSITLGKAADFVAFDAQGDDPLRAILESSHRPSGTWTSGRRIYS